MTPAAQFLETPISYLPGIGPQRGELLHKELEIATFGDLLQHYPYRYYDRTQFAAIAALTPGDEFVQIRGTIKSFALEGEGRKTRLKAIFTDGSSIMELVWFQSISWVERNIVANRDYVIFGKATFFNGTFSISHPEIEIYNPATLPTGLQPVYSSTQKLIRWGITNRSFAKLTNTLLQQAGPMIFDEVLPPGLAESLGMMERNAALRGIHFPENMEEQRAAILRLKWEELFLSQISVARVRAHNTKVPGYRFDTVGDNFLNFYHYHLAFQLTGAQQRVVREIRRDTATGIQMNRLLQGDVGSGKTIVALLTMLLALDNGFQAALMAPTEILSQQHFAGISELLEKMKIPVAILTGSIKGKERKRVLAGLEDGSIRIVIGTHALIEEKVKFQNLGLAIIDEQHRFGVGQRAKLYTKNQLPPHILVMTATPIPRTLAMTLYGDLEVSTIDELPPGRTPIQTVLRTDVHRLKVMEFIRNEIGKGRQAYIVYPLIEESEKLDFESLIAGYEQVKLFFPDHRYKIAMVHGRQESGEKERNMQRFVKGEAQILVATTVIEVGVNVPNATVMAIESAERFGLSQLHQLRGRVGRGADQSYCILLTGQSISPDTRKRMEVIVGTTDGFAIAREDLKLRGPGDLHGTRQSGVLKFKLADIIADEPLLISAREAALRLITDDPEMEKSWHQGIRDAIYRKGRSSKWGKIG